MSKSSEQPYLPLLPFLTKYPFLKVAGSFLQEEYATLIQILNSEKTLEFEARKLGKNIIMAIFQKTKFNFKHPELGFICSVCEEKVCKSFCEEGAFKNNRDWRKCNLCGNCFRHCSYKINESIYRGLKVQAKKFGVAHLFSRLLVSCLEDWVRRRYAIKEARRYAGLIEKEENLDDLLEILSTDLGIDAVIDESVNIHVSAYLRGAARIKAEKWRLVNRKLKNGYVEITKKDLIRLIEEYIRVRLEEKVGVSDEIREILTPYIREIEAVALKEKEKFAEIKFREVNSYCFPPCMKKILSDLQSGVNVPHSARFAVTAFLLNIGLDVEEILNLFRMAPDFSEEKTRYQVEHIAGAKGTEYDCPACDTMRTYHNCYANESCAKTKTYHPISYYDRCMRRVRRARRVKG